ncbi:hypothetical protein POTOM_000895 [Populus tomentosa]|uniref:Uncharacterized protein n=1 Tax=Populus tomentosa TaxID=118781 RepID=A0A8X8IV99_POPTO|nr:hypothetical protein POTOM_000895 [Populus tomentosa]
MCQLSSPSDSSKSKVDPSTRVQGSDMLALIPKNPIFQEQHKTDHLSFAIKEARCIAKIYSTSNDINWSFTLFSLHDLQQSQATLFSLAFPWEWNPFVAKLLYVWTNFSLVGSLIIYVMISGVYKKTWGGISLECLKGWKSLLNLASISLGLSTDISSCLCHQM